MKGFLILIGILAIIASPIFFNQANDKYANYFNDEDYSILNENVYVGGDAYNYIINGTYFTGFSILGIGSLLLGMLCLGLAHISSNVEASREALESIRFNVKKGQEGKND